MSGEQVGTVQAIHRYAVKSLQGESIEEGAFEEHGLVDDRSWGIVDTTTGHVLTAKRTAALLDARATLTVDGPLVELPSGQRVGPGAEGDAAISAWLGVAASLRKATEAATTYEMSFNVVDQDVDKFEWQTPEGSFRDLAPVHVLTSSALGAANAAHPESVWSAHRFRPTILLTTEGTGFIENDWVGATLAIGTAQLEVTMPTIRCSLPTKAQPAHGLDRDLQVFKSLAAVNQQNLGAYTNVRTAGTVRVGDAVTLIR